MMMPPLGCAAVPLPKKKLTSVSRPPPTPTAAEVGVLATEAAALETFDTELADSAGAAAAVTVAVFLVGLGFRLPATDDRGFCRAGPAFAVGLSLDDELLEEAEPFEPAVPVESAEATAGTDAIAAPTPRATAEAPIQVSILRWPGADSLGTAIPPNSTGSIRSSWHSDSN
jgi:hypothetical protein